jgi:hypothetical protein
LINDGGRSIYRWQRPWKPRNDKLVPVSTTIPHAFQHSSFVRIPPTHWIREILPLFAVDTPKAMLFVISDQSLVFATEKERLPSFSMVDESVMKLDAWCGKVAVT